jgi:hypothetical protein
MSADLKTDVARWTTSESELLEDCLTECIDAAAALGARLDLHWGFEGLKDVPLRDQPLFPGFDPDYGGTGFWISIREAAAGPDSPIIGHFGAYALSLHPLNLADYIEQHSIYRTSRDHFVLGDAARGVAEKITDMAVFIGCTWVHPAHRGTPLTHFLAWSEPVMLAAVSHAKWAAPHYFYFVKDRIAQSYGLRVRPQVQVPGVHWYRDGVPVGGMRHFGYISAEAAMRDIDIFVKTRHLSARSSTPTSRDWPRRSLTS